LSKYILIVLLYPIIALLTQTSDFLSKLLLSLEKSKIFTLYWIFFQLLNFWNWTFDFKQIAMQEWVSFISDLAFENLCLWSLMIKVNHHYCCCHLKLQIFVIVSTYLNLQMLPHISMIDQNFLTFGFQNYWGWNFYSKLEFSNYNFSSYYQDFCDLEFNRFELDLFVVFLLICFTITD
jgi:hypothetical protein